jgi:predicted nucleic acid-binding protein
VAEADLFLSVLTLGEVRKGIESLRPRDAARAGLLEAWLAELAEAFGPRILAIDAAAAAEWGRLAAGRSVPVIDALLAATARLHGLVLVTRNTADLDGLDVRLLNPFESARH